MHSFQARPTKHAHVIDCGGFRDPGMIHLARHRGTHGFIYRGLSECEGPMRMLMHDALQGLDEAAKNNKNLTLDWSRKSSQHNSVGGAIRG